MVVGPGVVVEAEDQPAIGLVLLLCHPAILPPLIVVFCPSWWGFTVINSGGDGSNREGLGAENVLGFEVVVFVDKDPVDVAWDNAHCRTSGHHPSLDWEAVDFGWRWCLGRTVGLGGVLGHGG